MNYEKRYQKIVDDLIVKGFPELAKKDIRAFELKITKLYGTYIPFFEKVGVNRSCRNFSKKEIIGILAHELCHAEFAKRDGFLKSFFLYIKYWIFSSVRKEEEDRADKMTIRRGYARELILSTKRLEEEYPKYKDKTYMSSKKIKSYAKKIRKW